MLIKRTERQARRGTLAAALQDRSDGGLDRRAFLRRSGLIAGSLATIGALPSGSVRKAEAGAPPPAGAQVTIRKNICTFCSVGCTVAAEVADGVWIGQEPAWESPINRGSHCAKGAAAREVGPGIGLLARLRQVLQRGRLSQSQVRCVLGHQQRRPRSTHLPLDHRRRPGQYLGLWRDDQQLQ